MKKSNFFSLFSKRRNNNSAVRSTSLRMENLEERQLLSVTDLAPLVAENSAESAQYADLRTESSIDLSALNVSSSATAYNVVNTADEFDSYAVVSEEDKVQLDTPVVSLTGKTTTSFSVSWEAVDNAAGYGVYLNKLDGSNGSYEVVRGTTYEFTGLDENTKYVVGVEANPASVSSDYTQSERGTLNVTTGRTLSAPTGLVCSTATSNSLSPVWDSVEGAVRYRVSIYQVGESSPLKTVTVDDKTATFDDLEPNTFYSISVQAVGDSYDTYDSESTGKLFSTTYATLARPDAKVTGKTTTSFSISWNSVDHAENYVVKLKYGDDEFISQTVSSDTTSYVFSDLKENLSYTASVYATGDSSKYVQSESSELTVVTGRTLSSPTNVVKSASSYDSLTITWGAVEGASAYVATLAETNNIDAEEKTLRVFSPSATFNDLAPKTTYALVVYAVGDNFDTFDSEKVSYEFVTERKPLSTPSVSLSSRTDSSIFVEWDSVEPAISYDVELTLDNVVVKTDSVSSDTTSYEFTDLADGQEYYVSVWANADESSAYLRSDAGKVAVSTMVKLETPTNVVVSETTDTTITVSWDPVEGAGKYEVTATEVEGGVSQSFVFGGAGGVLTGLSWRTNYAVSVRALGDGSNSVDSETTGTNAETQIHEYQAPVDIDITGRTDDTISVSWKVAEGEAAEQYLVKVLGADGAVIAYTTTAKTAAVITGIGGVATFTIVVVAIGDGRRSADSDPSSTDVDPTTHKLDKPMRVWQTDKDTHMISVEWDPVENATSYTVSLSGRDADGEEITLSPSTSGVTYTFTNLASGNEFPVSVVAYADGYLPSDSAETTAVTDKEKLETPKNLVQVGKVKDSITVKWDPVEHAEYYFLTINGQDSKGNTISSTTNVYEGTTRTFEGLSANTKYTITVGARAKDYEPSDDATIVGETDLAKLKKPADLDQPYKERSNSITVTWDPVEDATQYNVVLIGKSASSEDEGDTIRVEKVTAVPMCTIEGLPANTTFDFYVSAAADGYYPSDIAKLAVTTNKETMASPTNLEVVGYTHKSVTLKWDPVENAKEYLIYYKHNGEPKSRLTTETTFEVGILNPGTDYKFYVAAGADDYIGSDPVSISAKTALATPKGLVVSDKSKDSLSFTWKAVDGADSYTVSFTTRTDEGETTVLSTFDAAETTASFDKLTPGAQYAISVVANGADKLSSLAATLETSTTPKLSNPNPSSISGANSVTVSWDAVDGAKRYIFAYKLDEADEWTVVKNYFGTSYTIKKLESDAKVITRVKAIGDQIRSVNSDWSYLETAPAQALAAPTNLAASETTQYSVSLKWDAVADAETYVVSYVEAGVKQYRVVTEPSCVVSGLSESTEYAFCVVAESITRSVSEKTGLTVLTLAYAQDAQRLAQPDALAVVLDGDVLRVSWNAVENALRYIVEYRVAGTEEWTIVTKITEPSCAIEGADSNSSYDVRVKAVANRFDYNNSAWSYASYKPLDLSGQDDGEELDETALDNLAFYVLK